MAGARTERTGGPRRRPRPVSPGAPVPSILQEGHQARGQNQPPRALLRVSPAGRRTHSSGHATLSAP
ncbi:hypothetical protein SLNWT_4247 [Streptomyces albus]|uniref:Uncharacterized protein n=1 Tax=Streptomyces albus (strain ATCC 21838 / DSM 41398 / FERM P-419 / JCM 4703 / NBRC 107858) TaxID=1081613 RepID=A0A0B5EPC7_STRA4|nr:hypothetical protein SLNWT_4247 [Streptomyces albus]AOU78932.1 hypothetical protein SLNHY_4241 [Streptomyces albus]